jgi:hypothetical protein
MRKADTQNREAFYIFGMCNNFCNAVLKIFKLCIIVGNF